MALAHPNEGPALVNHVAKEAFVIALGDPTLQLKVIEREPKTVEDALNIAVKMEAYQASVVSPESDKGAADHKVKHKVKSTYAVEGTEQVVPAGEDDMTLGPQIPTTFGNTGISVFKKNQHRYTGTDSGIGIILNIMQPARYKQSNRPSSSSVSCPRQCTSCLLYTSPSPRD